MSLVASFLVTVWVVGMLIELLLPWMAGAKKPWGWPWLIPVWPWMIGIECLMRLWKGNEP